MRRRALDILADAGRLCDAARVAAAAARKIRCARMRWRIKQESKKQKAKNLFDKQIDMERNRPTKKERGKAFRSDENGKIQCTRTIIPRQIRDAASRCGLKPVYGYTSSARGIIAFDEEVREQVGEEVTSQYYVEGDGYKSAGRFHESGYTPSV